jgi:Ser/Thr protein kinase RdoA (MazF antagonist)
MELSELTKDLLNELFEIREGQLFRRVSRGVDLPRGVYRCRGKFMARLAAAGKDFFSSARDTPEEAFEVYKKMHRKRYGEFSPFESEAI